MPDVKWIKISTEIFDDEKIKIIDSMPDRDALLVIWQKLLVQAGRCNDGGNVTISDGVIYTAETLATVFNRPVNTVRLALDTFEKFGMIECNVTGIYIVNFEKYQNMDWMEHTREITRKRVASYRERKRQQDAGQMQLVAGQMQLVANSQFDSKSNVTLPSVTVTGQNKIRIREELDNNREDKNLLLSDKNNCNVTDIFLLYETTIEPLKNGVKEQITIACNKYSSVWVIDAILKAADKENNKRNWEYIAGILRNWEKVGHVPEISPLNNTGPPVLPPNMLTPTCSIERAIRVVEGKESATQFNTELYRRELIKRGIKFNEISL